MNKVTFHLHFSDIVQTYGKVFCINLLKSKTVREERLTQEYVRHVYNLQDSIKDKVKY